MVFSKPESCYSTVCYASQLGSYVHLWALHFKRAVDQWRCNQNSKRCENHVMCGGRKTESNSQEHQKVKLGYREKHLIQCKRFLKLPTNGMN